MLALAFFVIIGCRTAAKRRGRAAGGDGARVHGLSLERTGAEGQRRRKNCPILMPMPMDEVYAAEYKKLLAGVIANKELPIVCNLNIGHALPRCILPFGVRARVDAGEQVIRFG